MKTLQDIGERALIRDIVSRFTSGEIGDDCAFMRVGANVLALTTDPVPPPAAEVIGRDSDPFWKGWLLVTINASDLAAAAAMPLGLLVAAEVPSETNLDNFERFLEGVAAASRAEKLKYLGGNLREAPRFNACATAVGMCGRRGQLGRKGASDGDLLVIVGQGGAFWADAFHVRSGGQVSDKMGSHLFAPRSQLVPMGRLADVVPLKATIDNSDGLIASIDQMASASGVGAVLDLDRLPPPNNFTAYPDLSISHQRLWLGWGDWNVIVAVPKSQEEALQGLVAEGLPLIVGGYFTASLSGTHVRFGSELITAPRIESERFARDSWFSSGIDGYVEILQSARLPGGL